MSIFSQLFFSRARRRVPGPVPAGGNLGFSLVELMMVMAVLMLLAGLTLSGLGKGKDAFDLERAAYDVVAHVEYAAAEARASGREWYLLVAGADVLPAEAAGRAYRVVNNANPTDVDWRMLPRDMAFDRMPIPVEEVMISGESSRISGPFYLILILTPDGEFRAGPDVLPEQVSLKIGWGKVVPGSNADSPMVFVPDPDSPTPKAEIRFSPRTGAVRVGGGEE